MSSKISVRLIASGDNEAIRAIYNHAVRHTTATMDIDERSQETQQAWMDAHDGRAYPGIVAVDVESGTVIGYGSLSALNPKPGYFPSVENSIYVHPEWKGLGIGGLLLAELIAQAKTRGFRNIVALISTANDVSLRLHRRYGFEDAGLLRGIAFKHDKWVDVAYLQLRLDAAQ